MPFLGAAATYYLALGLLSLLLAALLLAMRRHYARLNYKPSEALFYFIYLVYTRIAWRATIDRPLPVKPNEGAIIVCNHTSSIDPAFIQLGVDRSVRWMVAKEYVEHPLLAWPFRILRTIPVGRVGRDTAAIRMAVKMARHGELVGLFPEGRINRSRQVLLPGRQGVALIALKARVPVIPCYVSGAPYDGTEFGCFLMSAKTHVRVGEPIDLSAWYDRDDTREVLDELTILFLREIAKLAGHPDFEPQLAGTTYKTDRTPEETAGAEA